MEKGVKLIQTPNIKDGRTKNNRRLRFLFVLLNVLIISILGMFLIYSLAPIWGLSPDIPVRNYDGILVLSLIGVFILSITLMYMVSLFVLNWIFRTLHI